MKTKKKFGKVITILIISIVLLVGFVIFILNFTVLLFSSSSFIVILNTSSLFIPSVLLSCNNLNCISFSFSFFSNSKVLEPYLLIIIISAFSNLFVMPFVYRQWIFYIYYS